MSELWTKLSRFNIDSGDELLTFERRLARENGWTPDYARRVIEEYKRFVFLCCEAGHPCTPSDQVDQVWHLHLTYTRSYWKELCQKVLQRPLHHQPTRGGRKEGVKFSGWYSRTLESYERLFGEKPPAGIWPSAEERFGVDPYAQRVNLKRHWVIPKRPVMRAALLVPLLLFSLTIGGCSDPGAGLFCGLLHILLGAFLLWGLDKLGGQSSRRSGSPGVDFDGIESGGDSDAGGGDGGCGGGGCGGCGGCGG